MRPSGRAAEALRELHLEPGAARHAEGSCRIRMGLTEVLCTASVEARVPPFLRNSGQGWVTAEYGMLPRATHTRGDREAARGKQSGRTQEIQRLIGRSLRAVTDLKAMGEMSITLDCDVLTADGGTRCASVTGAWVALHLAFQHCVRMKLMPAIPLRDQVAAVSCGIFDGTPVLDLDYAEDSKAGADANFVLTGQGGLVEVQGTAEGAPFSEAQLLELLRLARVGTTALFARQREAIGGVSNRRLEPGRLVLATHNAGKLREVAALLAPYRLEAVSAGALGLSEPAETADSFIGNATIKAVAAAQATGLPALADDSGFCVAALNGAPGVRTADWAMRPDGARDYAMGIARVAAEAGDAADRAAWFVCALVLAWPDGRTASFEGRVDGHWVWPPRGEGGFGFDPIFAPEGGSLTFGEMSPAQKHAVNHRARAFAKLAAECLPAGAIGEVEAAGW